MTRAILVLIALVVAGVAAIGVLDGGGNAAATRAVSTPDCGPVEFDRYDAGASVDGLQKSDTVRLCEPDVGAPTRVNKSVTFYGTCTPTSSDGGCAPPVQVASWPSCERNLSLYKKYPAPDGTTEPYMTTTIRGVPAAIFDGGQQIEVYTAATTIVIFSENSGLARAAASRLTGVHDGRVVRPTDDLPVPAEGALAGELTC